MRLEEQEDFSMRKGSISAAATRVVKRTAALHSSGTAHALMPVSPTKTMSMTIERAGQLL